MRFSVLPTSLGVVDSHAVGTLAASGYDIPLTSEVLF
jgi:hypothetical protein